MQMTQETHTPDYLELTSGLSVLHLQFQVRAIDEISFGVQPGSQLRGALYGVLSESFCGKEKGPTDPDHAQTCPVCRLLAAEDPKARRGRFMSRPMTIEPPLQQRIQAGKLFTFGISLIGWAQDLLLYIVRAVELMGKQGVGRGRGRFALEQMSEHSPLLDATRTLLADRTVRQATLQVTAPRVLDFVAQLPTHEVTLELITPMRLTAASKLVKKPEPLPFIQRLVERCQSMMEYHATAPTMDTLMTAIPSDIWRSASEYLCTYAFHLTIEDDQTKWVEAHSGSRHKGRTTPISGLVGTVTWYGDLTPLLPWLAWGQSLHVGKDAVKGDGWYRILTD